MPLKLQVPRKSVALLFGYLIHIHAYLSVGHSEGLKALTILCLGDNQFSSSVIEAYATCLLINTRLNIGSLYA